MTLLSMGGRSIYCWRNYWILLIYQGIELEFYKYVFVNGLMHFVQRSSHMGRREDS